MEKLYRLKNPFNGNYYCKSADTFSLVSCKEEAIVYTQAAALKLLPQANSIQEIYEEHNGNKNSFPGLSLEPTLLEDIYLLPKWVELIKKYATQYNLSVDQATMLFRKQLVLFWSQWADYGGPFGKEKMPSMPSPMEKLILDNKYDF